MSKAVSNVLCRCDARFDSHIKLGTYYNEALNCHSVIDYFLVSDKNIVNAIEVMDPDINFSDHRPIVASFHFVVSCGQSSFTGSSARPANEFVVKQLGWDHADLALYCSLTGYYLYSSYLLTLLCLRNRTRLIELISIVYITL